MVWKIGELSCLGERGAPCESRVMARNRAYQLLRRHPRRTFCVFGVLFAAAYVLLSVQLTHNSTFLLAKDLSTAEGILGRARCVASRQQAMAKTLTQQATALRETLTTDTTPGGFQTQPSFLTPTVGHTGHTTGHPGEETVKRYDATSSSTAAAVAIATQCTPDRFWKVTLQRSQRTQPASR